MDALSSIKPFFILGCGRSGTTVLQQALNRHSAIVVPPETRFFYRFVGRSMQAQRQYIATLNTQLGTSLEIPESEVQTRHDVRDCYHQLASHFLREHGAKTCFGEKTPRHMLYVDRIAEVLPEAKLIVLFRDGRAVAQSRRKMPWASSDLLVNFADWLEYHHAWECLQAQAPLPYHYLRYEDLAASPEVELRKIATFLGLPYEEAMHHGEGTAESFLPQELPWKGRALEAIDASRVSSWQQELTNEELLRLERWGRSALQAHGYPLLHDAQDSGGTVRERIALTVKRATRAVTVSIRSRTMGMYGL
ncbi:MAG: sulfotransferase [Bdellovibrionales bacterium]|nr:sulfotransferase [Bdellovibrionales bacterium]